ncbi:MAG: serine hydrolase [Bacteroidota bacterium]
MKKKLLIGLSIILLLFFLGFLFIRPQLRILAGYVAKNACSCAYVQGMAKEQIRTEDVGYGLLRFADFELNEEERSASSSVYGLVKRVAIYRGDLGCVLVPKAGLGDDKINPTLDFPSSTIAGFPFEKTKGDSLHTTIDNLQIQNALSIGFEALGTRAIVVVKNGQIIAEQYSEGFDENSLHLGWSMSKSITNALIGILVKQGKLSLDQNNLLEEWKGTPKAAITLNDLLQMNSGLLWEEAYGKACAATNMLFEEAAMGKYAAAQEREGIAGEKWYYSSGTSNILSEIIRRNFTSDKSYWNFPYRALFSKINTPSFRLEADASGTYVGSSYSYATARDWAKFGLLFLNNGNQNGQQILPRDWVNHTRTIAPNSSGEYGAHFWLNRNQKFPAAPDDLYYCGGFNGQYVFIIPSEDMVIVRLGIDGLGEMNANQLLENVLKSIRE